MFEKYTKYQLWVLMTLIFCIDKDLTTHLKEFRMKGGSHAF